MKLKAVASLVVGSIIIAFLYTNCAPPAQFTRSLNDKPVEATIGTNPMHETMAMKAVFDTLCAKVASCVPGATTSDCVSEAMVQPAVPYSSKLGFLPVNPVTGVPFVVVNDAVQAVLDGELLPIAPQWMNCIDNINSLACSDPGVQGAYNASAPFPYADLRSAIPFTTSQPDCGHSF